LHVVAARRSSVFDAAALARLRAAAGAYPRVRVHELASAGHWVHVDAPDDITALVVDAL
jgi:pimeloyl-ACP methyl ester carboxylesterase